MTKFPARLPPRAKMLAALLLCGLLTAQPAWALDLAQARATGQVGEQLTGYIAALKPAPDVDALVSSVNAKRQQAYQAIAQQSKQPVDVVAKLAAPQVIQSLPAGAQYQAADGSWATK